MSDTAKLLNDPTDPDDSAADLDAVPEPTDYSVAAVLSRAAATLDSLPVSPSSLAKRLTDKHYDRSRRRAASHPLWASIEKRRDSGRPDSSIFLSGDLTMADWEIQTRIATELTPDPFWLSAAYRLHRFTFVAAAHAAHSTTQRLRQGWSDRDVWSLHAAHSRSLGAQLVRLAEISHGWPSSEFETFEDWTEALRLHGETLRSEGWTELSHEVALEEWSNVSLSQDFTPEEKDKAHVVLREHEDAAQERVRVSLQWVVDYYGHLWA